MAQDDGNRPVTKAELAEALGDLEGRLVEVMRDMQTEILRAFHSGACPMEIRLERRLPPPAPRL